MNVSARHVEETDTYELGIEVDGQFVTFAAVDGPTVRGRVESQRVAEAAQQAGQPAQAPGQ